MKLRSTTFTGQYPIGLHWSPGETRELPKGYPLPEGDLPKGLEEVTKEETPVEPAPAEPVSTSEPAPVESLP